MRTLRTIAISAFSAALPVLQAQDTLSLDQALALALSQEHGIRMARNDAAAADALATPGNAGLLPRVDLSGRGTYRNQFTKLDFIEALPDVERSGVESTLLSGTLGLAWTLFDGFGSFQAYERAQLDAELADIRLRAQVEGTLGQVIALYHTLAALQEDARIAEALLGISSERLARLEGRAALGGAGRLEVLNATVDLQADSTVWVLTHQRIDRTMHELNVLMGRSPSTPLAVSRTTTHADGLDVQRLVGEALARNVQVLAATNATHAARTEVRSAKALLWPRLDLNAGYGLSDQRNEVGVVLGTYNRGLSGGLTASMPLFDGGRVRTRMESARLRAESAALAEEQARLAVERDVRNAFVTWRTQRKLMEVQRASVATARLNFERTRDLFYAGQLTGLQFRQAQLDLARTEREELVASLDAKLAELQLLQASGGLLRAVGLAIDGGR